ncbi:MAG: MopE-related protein [Parcubacteria group bacterium]
MNKIIYFLKYHNAIPIILGVVLLGTAGAFANEDVRSAVIGQKVENIIGIDNAQLLSADLDNFDQALRIEDVTQDNENYYINYIYRTLAIRDNVWQEVLKENTLTVGIKSMEGKDLGLYVQEELSEVADWELNHLKRVQSEEKEIGITILTASVDYTGLIGLVLDARDKILPGYKPVVTQEICDGIDNNKNGQIDEGFKVGQICLVGNGICQRQGIYDCSSDGKSVCSAVPGEPGQEICDSIDNDCDGQIDEENVCQNETQKQPEIICTPAFEICNGVDDDCDNEIDEAGVCISEPIVNPPIELTPTTTEEAATTTESTTTEPTIEQPPAIEELPTEPATTTEE